VTRGRALTLALLIGAVVMAVAARADSLRVDGATALHHVERLVAMGPRVAGTPGGARARAYIVAELRKLGIRTDVRTFQADTPQGRFSLANVVGVLPGRRRDVILLGGHYDTKYFKEFRFVGANDGGSSAALLLELARVLAGAPREYTYWLVWFDGEEARVAWTATDSLYGSRQLAAELARAAALPRAMILLDMIGDRDLGILRETSSTPWLSDILWASAARLGHGRHFLGTSMNVEDDHAPFLAAGVPSALLIDFDYAPWHTDADTLDKVSAQSLGIVGDVVLDALPSVEQYLTTHAR